MIRQTYNGMYPVYVLYTPSVTALGQVRDYQKFQTVMSRCPFCVESPSRPQLLHEYNPPL